MTYNINKAYFKRSSFSNYVINNAVLTETKLNDCKVVNSRIVNSQINNSVIKDSTYISEDSIKILAVDEWYINDEKLNIMLISGPAGIGKTRSLIESKNRFIKKGCFR